MLFDDIFRINGDSLAFTNLPYYLVEHKATEVNLKYKIFDTAFNITGKPAKWVYKKTCYFYGPQGKMQKYLRENKHAIKEEIYDRIFNSTYYYYRRKKN